MSTISGTTVTTGVTLGPPGTYTSPLTITSTGGVSNSAGDAVFAAAAYANATLVNYGTVIGSSDGVDFKDGGSVTNSGIGLIQGYNGVYMSVAGGTVTNSATIAGTGGLGAGVRLIEGSVTNTGTGLIQGYDHGVSIVSLAGTVVNSATIAGTGYFADGIRLGAGGSVDNTGTGLIQGYYAVVILGSAGAVTNSATIAATGRYGVRLAAGGSVDNTGAGLIRGYNGVVIQGTAAGTVTNSATIAGTSTNGAGVRLGSGGSVTNTGTGLIQGGRAVDIRVGVGTVTNSATIAGTGRYGVYLGAGGSVDNTGTGLIQGYNGVYVFGSAGTVTNSGTIAGTGRVGVRLLAGGTVVDSGTISGANGTAVYFNGTGSNLLVLESGYALAGIVVGGTSAGATNTLELGSATGAGTLSAALQTEFANFETITVDAGANWTLSSNNTLGSGVTLSDFGRLTNAGTISIAGGQLIVDPATLDNSGYIGGTVTLAGHGYLDNTGTIAAAGTAVLGTTNLNTVVNSGTIAGTGGVGYGVRFLTGGDVTNTGTGLIEGRVGVFINNTVGAVTNSATIAGEVNGFGVRLGTGGSVTNTGTGLIQGQFGVEILSGAGTVANSGTIAGTAGFGVHLASGSVTNTGTGLIQGTNYGGYINGAAGMVTNSGTIAGTGSAGFGVRLFAGGTVIDSGTISGGNGTAIAFGGTGGNLLALEHGYVLSGTVTVAGTANTRVMANRYRGDLKDAGLGSGRHAFELIFPGGLPLAEARQIRVVREADGAELPGSPMQLAGSRRLDAAAEQTLAALLGGLAAADEERALSVLTEETERLLARRAARTGARTEREALRLFRRRWASEPPGEVTDAAATPRALVVDAQVPCATRDAGSVAVLSHIRALRALGYAVSVVAAEAIHESDSLARLAEEEDFTPCAVPFYSGVEDVLRRQAGSFDLVYLHRAAIAHQYLALARRYCPQARIVYSVGDLHHVRLARQAQVEGRLELMARSRHLAAVETIAARSADVVLTHSPVEAALLRRALEASSGASGGASSGASGGAGRAADKVHVVPFAVVPRVRCRPFAERHGIAFVGGVDHAPNGDAVHYLIRDILPLVWQADPTIGCNIVGHGWHAGRLPAVDARVEIVGPTANLDAVFNAVRLSVAPLRFGAGIKGKVLDSFAARLPCVMTPIAAEGFTLPGMLSELVGDRPQVLAELILHLHNNRNANTIAGAGAYRLASQFTGASVTAALADALSTQAPTLAAGTHETPTVLKQRPS